MSANSTQETVFTNMQDSNDAVDTDEARRRNAGLTLCSEEVSQTPELNSEDVLVENLFQACDPDGRGKVKVSDVVKYLTTLVGTQLQDNAVDSLVAVLDPAHLDAEVAREAFHRGLRQWINCMKSGYLMDANVIAAIEEPFIFDLSSSKQSLEDSVMDDKQCFSQLSSSLNDLHHQNHRLSEENQEVRSLLDIKEEELARLTKDLLSTRSQIKRLQEMADRRHEVEAENEELREQMMSLTSKLDVEKQKSQQLEQERELLKLQMQRLKSQVVKLTSDLDSAQQQHEDFKSLLADYKEKISQLKTTCSDLDVQAAEKIELVQEMQFRLQEMSSTNESLKSQNQELQLQLGEAQQELVRITVGEASNEVNSSAEPETVSRANIVGQLTPPVFQKCSSSIHNELQNLLNDSPDLPWPLSEKELKDSGFTAPDLVSQVGDTSHQNKQSFEEEPTCLTEPEPTCLTEPEPQSDSESGSSSSGVTDTCSCGHSFEISNEKLRQFVTLMKYFKEENHKLRHIIKRWFKDREVFWKVLKGDGLSPTSTLFKDAAVVRSETIIPEEHSLKEAITLIRNLKKSHKKALVEISQLQRCNLELTEELHKSELRISELDEECQHIQSCICQEKQKCAELEESLYKNTLARQLDLRDIWRLVQKDVEAECEDAQDDHLYPITPTERKDKIMKEIKTLRLELQSKEAFLGSLSNNNVSLPCALNYGDQHTDSRQAYLGGRFSSPTPLADTMRMDLFNGNHPGYRQPPVNQYSQSLVSCEDVDCYECQAACLFLQNRFRSSYPSVKHADVNHFKPEIDLVMSNRTADKYNQSHVTSVSDNILKAVPESDRRMYGYNKWLVYSANKPTDLENTAWNKSYPHQQSRSSSDFNSGHKNNNEPLVYQTRPVRESNHSNRVTGLDQSSHVTNIDQPDHVTGLDSKLCDNILFASSVSLTDNFASVQDIHKEPIILRDTISEIKHKAKSVCTQASQTNHAEDTILPEGLPRRPSYYAAVEQGKQRVTRETTTQPPIDEKSSPDKKSRPTNVTKRNQNQNPHQAQSTATSQQLKSVTFHLVEEEGLDSVDYATGEDVQLSNSVDTSSLPVTSSSSSQSSALVSISLHSSTDDPNFTLSSRYLSQKRNLDGSKLMEQLESLANEASREAKDGADCITSVTASQTTAAQPTGAEPQPTTGGLTVGSTQTQLHARVSFSATPDCHSGGKKNWLAKQRRAQMKAGRMKLPEVSEHPEVDARDQMTTATGLNGSVSGGPRTTATRDMPQISVTDEETPDSPALTTDVMEDASVPDSLLTKIGLSVANSCANELSIDRLSDKDLESKFLNLSLAFKTDKLTMDKRVNVQQRARDLTEQNVETELTGLRITVETLNELVTDAEVRSLLQKIKLHLSVLEQTTLRLSSRAEVYGAVQQEKRLCKAMEVVVMYTENLRRIREKEESELQEARKLLSERSGNSISTDSESGPGRRSLSVVGYNTVGRVPRRKSEIALPRLVGGGGSPSLVPTSTLEIMPPILGPTVTSNTSQETDEGEDPKSRFQSAVASTSLQNVVTSTIRTCSQDRRFPLLASSSSRLSCLQTSTASILPERRGENIQLGISNDEAAFRKGYEEGLKVKLSRELSELRDEQNNINQSLEEVMEKVDQSQLEDELFFSRPTRLEAALSIGSHLRSFVLQYDWRSNKKVIRNLAGVFFFLLAVMVMFLMPPSPTVDLQHISTPPQ